MTHVYKITGSATGGKCYCGHHNEKGKPYWLVDMKSKAFTFCEKCGTNKRFKGIMMTAEQLMAKWFGSDEPIEKLKKSAVKRGIEIHQKVEKMVPIEAVSV